jgi:hypothetical protein
MYTQQEFQEHYLEVTGNEPRPKQTVTAPDFEGYFKHSFELIDDLFMTEVADGSQVR